jgi:hypothetical protein
MLKEARQQYSSIRRLLIPPEGFSLIPVIAVSHATLDCRGDLDNKVPRRIANSHLYAFHHAFLLYVAKKDFIEYKKA